MKRLLLLLTLVHCALAFVNAQGINSEFTENGIKYKITNTSPMEVAVAQSDYSGDIAIPQEVVNNSVTYKVTLIGDYAFRNCSSLTSITIPESVTTIEDGAFYDCSSLASITIPSSVTTIREVAFSGCSSLTSITIPSSVTTIGDNAFESTPWFNNLEDGGVYINNMLYAYKGSMPENTEITIPEGTTAICGWAFYSKKMKSVNIPSSVTYIGSKAFYYCTRLTSITIPSSVTTIEGDAFRNCSSLTSITIPSSVTYIGDNAFRSTPWLNNLEDGGVYINNMLYAYKGSMPENTEITIPEGTTAICGEAFRYCSNLKSVNIPSSVTYIGNSAFSDCTKLTSVTINDGVSRIEEFAFSGCTNLSSIIIPNSVTYIGNSAFSRSGLTSITIPNNVTSIGQTVFCYCNELSTIEVDADNTMYYSGGNCIIEKGTKTLISGCKNSIIPNDITAISNYAFEGCSGLTSITIPSSVTTIGELAFSDCSSLTSITIPESVTTIEDGAFYDCSSLASITIPSSVTTIREVAFSGCSSLTSITIPSSVTTIGDNAFASCSNLKKVTCFAKEEPTIYSYTFNYTSLDTILVPINSVSAYANAEGWSSFSDKIFGLCEIKVTSNNNLYGTATTDTTLVIENKTATLTAIATEGYHFTQWSDGNTENPRTVTVISDTTFTAEFAINVYNVVATDVENGSVAIEGEYKHGSTITLTATATEGYHFTQWSDGNTENPRTVTVVSDVTFTAEFAKDSEQGNGENQSGDNNTGDNENNNVAISDNEATKLLVYPSPATSVVTIDGVEPNSLVKVYNINGAMVITTTLDGNSLNVANLAKGTYIIETENGTIARFVKQ